MPEAIVGSARVGYEPSGDAADCKKICRHCQHCLRLESHRLDSGLYPGTRPGRRSAGAAGGDLACEEVDSVTCFEDCFARVLDGEKISSRARWVVAGLIIAVWVIIGGLGLETILIAHGRTLMAVNGPFRLWKNHPL